jgi:hypothetical protein
MFNTRTARISLTEENYVLVEILPDVDQVLADAQENIRVCLIAAKDKRRPVLVDIRDAKSLTPQVREYYGGAAVTENFSAMALLVSGQPLGIMMGNVYFRVVQPRIPKRLFTDEAEAKAWVLGYL